MRTIAATLVLLFTVPAGADAPKKPAPVAKDAATRPNDAAKAPPKPALPPPFGKAMDSLKCQAVVDRMSVRKCVDYAESDLDEPCKAEFHARMEECKKRPADGKYVEELCRAEALNWDVPDASNLDAYCTVVNWRQIVAQAEIAKVTYPKADVHDRAIEKAIRAAYAEDWPDDKIVDVVITNRSYDAETDALERVTGRDVPASIVSRLKDGSCLVHSELWLQRGDGRKFWGAFKARGAGSQTRDVIDCALLPKGK